mmetsp:Transcript_25739/g.43647  ORF Transcript_25739/g.43647 Transcript_25739/m.43647 type:complete len:86 (-) Transcript_25739:75-332(-)
MMRDLAGVFHWPLTRLVTECGVVADPSEVGSSVAQDGRLVMQRRLFRRRAADEVGRRIESIMMMIGSCCILCLMTTMKYVSSSSL